MLTEEEKAFLKGYKEKMQAAVKSRSGAMPVEHLQRMAEIYKREVDAGFKFFPWCGRCKEKLLQNIWKHYGDRL